MTSVVNSETRLISEAEFGLYYAYLKITSKEAKRLQKEGLEVTDSHNSRTFPRLHKICWENALIPYSDINELNERSEQYSLAQKLWIISTKTLNFKI